MTRCLYTVVMSNQYCNPLPTTTLRTFTVTVEAHAGTYPDPGALAGAIVRTLTEPRTGLAVVAVTAEEV